MDRFERHIFIYLCGHGYRLVAGGAFEKGERARKFGGKQVFRIAAPAQSPISLMLDFVDAAILHTLAPFGAIHSALFRDAPGIHNQRIHIMGSR